MRTFECCFTCHAVEVPQEVVMKFTESTAREEGFLLENETFPDWTGWTVEMSPFYRVGGFRFIKVEVAVPEDGDGIAEFMSLVDGVDLGEDTGFDSLA